MRTSCVLGKTLSRRSFSHKFAIVIASLSLGAQQGAASSTVAWEEFRAEVIAQCRLAAGVSNDVLIEVDPFGSQSFGLAIVYSPKGKMICVYDKVTHGVELGTGLVGPSE